MKFLIIIKLGADVDYHDPLVPSFPKMRKYQYQKESVSIEKIKDYDCVILTTDHDMFDYDSIYQNANLIVDILVAIVIKRKRL